MDRGWAARAGAAARKNTHQTTALVNSELGRALGRSAYSKYMLKLFLAALKQHSNTNSFAELEQFQSGMN